MSDIEWDDTFDGARDWPDGADQALVLERCEDELAALRGAVQAVVDADQGFRHPALAVAIHDLRDALEGS